MQRAVGVEEHDDLPHRRVAKVVHPRGHRAQEEEDAAHVGDGM